MKHFKLEEFRCKCCGELPSFVKENVEALVGKVLDGARARLGKPVGVSTYEPCDSDGEDQLINYVDMCGIPLEPVPYFDDTAPVVFLTQNAACDPDIMPKLEKYVREGGIAIVRLSGEKAPGILKRMFAPKNPGAQFTHGQMHYGTILDAHGQRLDEAMAVCFYAPRSYTREDVCEIHTHGGVMSRLALEAAVELGARPAANLPTARF